VQRQFLEVGTHIVQDGSGDWKDARKAIRAVVTILRPILGSLEALYLELWLSKMRFSDQSH
jgi:hypothetical protein